MTTEATRQADWIFPPLAQSDGKSMVVAAAVTTTASYLDLNAMAGFPSNMPSPGFDSPAEAINVIGHYITLTADQGDVHILFGPSVASVTGANVPLATTTNTIAAGVPTLAVGVTSLVPSGTSRHFKIPMGPQGPGQRGANSIARYLAYVTRSGTATLRVELSSV